MCGRFTLIGPAGLAASLFDLPETPDWKPRFNVAPTQSVFVVRAAAGRRECSPMRWGLIPHWAASTDGAPLINARSETVAEKPAFRSAFARRRCLVPADGFFEWRAGGGEKRPHYFTLTGGGLFGIAGLWERWEGAGGTAIESVALLTTAANELVGECHDRMPVILPCEAYGAWLNDADSGTLLGLMRPYPASGMEVRPVGKAVGSPRNEGPQCLALPGPSQAMLF